MPSLPSTPALSPTPKKRKSQDDMVMVTPKKKKSTQEELTLEAENQTPLPARKQKLKAMVKKRPAASPVKKPAAKLPQKETEKKMWLKMYYKAGAWAIRKAGGPQLFQIVCKPGKKVEKIIDESLQKLADGMDPQKVKEWAKSQ